MALRARVAGTGMCVPDRIVTNSDLTQWMDTSEEWIEQRTGIQERRWVEEGQLPSELAEGAARQALEQARRRGLSARHQRRDVGGGVEVLVAGRHERPEEGGIGTAFRCRPREVARATAQ